MFCLSNDSTPGTSVLESGTVSVPLLMWGAVPRVIVGTAGRSSSRRMACGGPRCSRASATRGIPPEHHDAGLRVVVEELLPALRRVPGYRGAYLLAGGKPGAGLALVLWATEEASDAASADRRVAAAHVRLAARGLALESRQIFEVIAQDEVPHRT